MTTETAETTETTETTDSTALLDRFDPDAAYRLHPRVAIRPEPFGAMAYHYGNRRLNFLRHTDLVRVVERLDDYASINAALTGEAIAAPRHPAFRKALARLAASDFLEPRSD